MSQKLATEAKQPISHQMEHVKHHVIIEITNGLLRVYCEFIDVSDVEEPIDLASSLSLQWQKCSEPQPLFSRLFLPLRLSVAPRYKTQGA